MTWARVSSSLARNSSRTLVMASGAVSEACTVASRPWICGRLKPMSCSLAIQ